MEETKIFVLGSVSTYETDAFTASLQSANKSIKPTSEASNKNLVVIPPDGGWGWVVVMAAFTSYFMAEGVICSFGIFLTEMSTAFNCKISQVSLIGAIMTGCFCLSGPFSAALVNRYGYRKIGMIGSVIGTASCLLTSFSPSLYVTFFAYGFLAGLGYGMMYVATTIVVGYYFERWRPLAIGIAICGAGVGSVSLPPAMYHIVSYLGWRKTYRIMGALTVICVGTTATYHPLAPIDLTAVKASESKITSESNVLAEESSKIQKESCGEGVSFDKNAKIQKDSCGEGVSFNKSAKWQKDFFGEGVSFEENGKIQDNSCGEGVSFDQTEYSTVTLFLPIKLPRIVSSETIISGGTEKAETSGYIKPLKLDFKNSRFSDSHLSTVHEEVLETKKSKFCCCCCEQKQNKKKLQIKETYWSRTKRMLFGQKTYMRPMYRDDIFYSGSLLNLPEYAKSSTKSTSTRQSLKSRPALNYHVSVTRVTTQRDLEEEGKCVCLPIAVTQVLTNMLDLHLLKSPAFIMLALNAGFTAMCYYTPYMFIKDRALQNGIPENTAFWLISAIGFSNTLGRIGCGMISSLPNVKPHWICFIFSSVGGLATIFSGQSSDVRFQFFYASLFGITLASTSSLRSIIIVDILGLEMLSNAVGLIMLFQGAGTLCGTVTAGFLRDFTGNYEASFYFAGGCMFVGAFFLVPLRKLAKWEKRKG